MGIYKNNNGTLEKYSGGLNEVDTDDVLSLTSTNPIQNKVVTEAINSKVDKMDGKNLSSNDFTDDDKTKLSGIEEGANKTVVDSELSAISENPIQNKVVSVEIETLKKSVSDGKTLVANAITGKGVETATDATFATMADNIRSIETGGGVSLIPNNVTNLSAKAGSKNIVVSWNDPDDIYIGGVLSSEWGGTKVVYKTGSYPTSETDGTLVIDNKVRNQYSENGFTVTDLTPDTYYFSLFPYSKDGLVNENVQNRVQAEVKEGIKIVTFADGTDEEITAMIEAHYNDEINISDYWAVGDMRSVELSAMDAIDVGESHRAQTVQFVIGDFDHDDLTESINGHTKAAVTLLQKDCLMDATSASNSNNGINDKERGYINSANTNVDGWKSCKRRMWCNNIYFSALPNAWQNMVKTVNKKSGLGNKSSSGTEITEDKIFLAAEIELFGRQTGSVDEEGTQYQYYKNSTTFSVFYKLPKYGSSYSSQHYWTRSPLKGNNARFCAVNSGGAATDYNASLVIGIAPCLCI